MLQKSLLTGIVLLFVAGSVLAGQPKVVKATIEPTELAAGDTVTITVELTGKKDDVKEVSFLVREYPYDAPRRYLEPLKDGKKNIWMLVGPVPYEAPVQTYHLDFTVKDKDDKEVVTEGLEEQIYGKAATVKFKVVDKAAK